MRKTLTMLGLISMIGLAGCGKAEATIGDVKIEVGKEKETVAEVVPNFEKQYFDRIVAYEKDGIKIVAEGLEYDGNVPVVCMNFVNNTTMKQNFISQTVTVNDCIIHTEKEFEVDPSAYLTAYIPIDGLGKYGIDGSSTGNIEDIELDILVYAVQDENSKIPVDLSGYTAESGTIFIDLVDKDEKIFHYDAEKGLVAYNKNDIELVITDMYWDKDTNLPVLNMYAHNTGNNIRVLTAQNVMLNDNLAIGQCKTIIDPGDYLLTPLRLDTVDWSYWKEYYAEEGNVSFVEELDFEIGSTTYEEAKLGKYASLDKIHVEPKDIDKAKSEFDDPSSQS